MILVVGFLLVLPCVLADSIDSEIQKVARYAEQYESGNINYVQLMVYLSSAREGINEIAGAVGREHGGILKQEQIRNILGEPSEMTRWVHVEGEGGPGYERSLLTPVPVWNNYIIYDGKEIRIIMEAYPFIFVKRHKFEEGDYGGWEEEELVYGLHMRIGFKSDEIDIKDKIEGIKSLAESFNSDPSESNAKELAKESVNVEMAFEKQYRMSGKNCEDIMMNILGGENRKQTQETVVQEISFYQGDKFEVTARLEGCRECGDRSWINLNFDARGPGAHEIFREEGITGEIIKRIMKITGKVTGLQIGEDEEFEEGPDFEEKDEEFKGSESPKRFEGISPEQIRNSVREEINGLEEDLSQGNIGNFNKRRRSIEESVRNLNEICHERAWQEAEKIYGFQPGGEEQHDPYYWLERDLKLHEHKEELLNKCARENWDFLERLFEGKPSIQNFFTEVSFEKFLVINTEKVGTERCDNNIDDNGDGNADCDDQQCAGKFAGRETITVGEGEEAKQEEIEFFCIEGKRQPKPKEEEEVKGPVCGNHIPEPGECELVILTETVEEESADEEGEEQEETEKSVYCPEDCVQCPIYDEIECGEGEIGVSVGEDENGCQKPPVCVVPKPCHKNLDCVDVFRCGIGECVFEHEAAETGKCELKELTECRKAICTPGEPLVTECPNGEELVTAICGDDGLPISLNVECPSVPGKVCCMYPGPADEPLYEWRNEEDCSSPEGAEWGEKIVSNAYCEERASCDEICKSQPHEDCEGKWEISGEHPNCDCNWECEEPTPGAGNECETREDCGGENDVCSNGYCETIIKTVKVDKCIDVDCEEGFHCDFRTGECVEDVERNECDVIYCEEGYDCNPETERCEPIPGWEEEREREEIKEEKIEKEEPEEPEEPPTEEPKTEPEPVEPVSEEPKQESEPPQPEETTEPVAEEPATEEVTGNVIFRFFGGLINVFRNPRITGKVTGFEVTQDEGGDNIGEPEPEPRKEQEPAAEPESEPDNECRDKWKACGDPCPPCDYEQEYEDEGNWDEDTREDERRWEEERKEQEQRCKEEADRKCEERVIVRCVEDCVFGDRRGGEERGDLGECQTKCKEEKKQELDNCVKDIFEKCEEDRWEEIERDEREEREEEEWEMGAFVAHGSCRTSQGRTESHIHFGGWDNPFEKVEEYKHKYYRREGDWCKDELKNLIKQREKMQEGFNQEFARWFLEEYMANTADEWEQHISGIFELYWRNVDIMMQMSHTMICVGKSNVEEVMNIELIDFEHETENGKIRYWEEIKEVKMPGVGEVRIVSPYMQIWIFPPPEFMKAEMKKAMAIGEFPGPPEEKMERRNQEGPTAEERKYIKQDKKFMKFIRELSGKYGGNLEGVVQIVDGDEIIFNVYIEVNEDVIMVAKPMLPEETPKVDVTVKIPFELVFEIIEGGQKEMMGSHIESPPWDRKAQPIQKVKQIISGVKMYFTVRKIISSSEVIPTSAEEDVREFLKKMFNMAMKGGREGPFGMKGGPEEEGGWGSEERSGGFGKGGGEGKGGFGGFGGGKGEDKFWDFGGEGGFGGPGGPKGGSEGEPGMGGGGFFG